MALGNITARPRGALPMWRSRNQPLRRRQKEIPETDLQRTGERRVRIRSHPPPPRAAWTDRRTKSVPSGSDGARGSDAKDCCIRSLNADRLLLRLSCGQPHTVSRCPAGNTDIALPGPLDRSSNGSIRRRLGSRSRSAPRVMCWRAAGCSTTARCFGRIVEPCAYGAIWIRNGARAKRRPSATSTLNQNRFAFSQKSLNYPCDHTLLTTILTNRLHPHHCAAT